MLGTPYQTKLTFLANLLTILRILLQWKLDYDMTIPPPEIGVRWPKQARHTSQMDRLLMRGEKLAVAAPASPSGRVGMMASPPPPRRRWLLEGAGAAFQHVLTASTVTYDQSEHCPIRLRAWTDNQAIGGGLRGRIRFRLL